MKFLLKFLAASLLLVPAAAVAAPEAEKGSAKHVTLGRSLRTDCDASLKAEIRIPDLLKKIKTSTQAASLKRILKKRGLPESQVDGVYRLDLDSLTTAEIEELVLSNHFDAYSPRATMATQAIESYLGLSQKSLSPESVECFDLSRLDRKSSVSVNQSRLRESVSIHEIQKKIDLYARWIATDTEVARQDKKRKPNESAQWSRILTDLKESHPDFYYNKQATTLFDLFAEGKLQCSSGTTLYQLAALKAEAAKPKDKDKPPRTHFVVLTKGHIRSLVKDTQSRELYAIEHTADNNSLAGLGKVGERPAPMRIVTGKDYLAFGSIERFLTRDGRRDLAHVLRCRAGIALGDHDFLAQNEALIPASLENDQSDRSADELSDEYDDEYDVNQSALAFGAAITPEGDQNLSSSLMRGGGDSENDSRKIGYEAEVSRVFGLIEEIYKNFNQKTDLEKRRDAKISLAWLEGILNREKIFVKDGNESHRYGYELNLDGVVSEKDQAEIAEWILSSQAMQLFILGGPTTKYSFRSTDEGLVVEIYGRVGATGELRVVPLAGLKDALEHMKDLNLWQLNEFTQNYWAKKHDPGTQKTLDRLDRCLDPKKPCPTVERARHFMNLGIGFSFPDSQNPRKDLENTLSGINRETHYKLPEKLVSQGITQIYCVEDRMKFAAKQSWSVSDSKTLIFEMKDGKCDLNLDADAWDNSAVATRQLIRILHHASQVGLSSLFDKSVELAMDPEALLMAMYPELRNYPLPIDSVINPSLESLNIYQQLTENLSGDTKKRILNEIKENTPFHHLIISYNPYLPKWGVLEKKKGKPDERGYVKPSLVQYLDGFRTISFLEVGHIYKSSDSDTDVYKKQISDATRLSFDRPTIISPEIELLDRVMRSKQH